MGTGTGSGIGRRRAAVVAGLAAVVALGGCSTIQVKLGMRVELAKLPVTTMTASQYHHPGVGPGEKKSLVVTFTQPDGKVLVTAGKGKGMVQWNDLAVVATVVSVNTKGVLSLPSDPRVSDGKTGHVAITVPSHPDLKAELDIPLRYSYAFKASYSGMKGRNGTNGVDGISGWSGENGEKGRKGTGGTNGTDGGNGSDGPNVQVRVALQAGAHPLLQVGVTPLGDKEQYFLVDPQGGSLTVSSDGGAGGSGGQGGAPGGNSGRNGSPGRGGSITVTYDSAVAPYLAALKLSNPYGPKPVLKQASVAPLW